jgi:hypothetical protein
VASAMDGRLRLLSRVSEVNCRGCSVRALDCTLRGLCLINQRCGLRAFQFHLGPKRARGKKDRVANPSQAVWEPVDRPAPRGSGALPPARQGHLGPSVGAIKVATASRAPALYVIS